MASTPTKQPTFPCVGWGIKDHGGKVDCFRRRRENADDGGEQASGRIGRRQWHDNIGLRGTGQVAISTESYAQDVIDLAKHQNQVRNLLSMAGDLSLQRFKGRPFLVGRDDGVTDPRQVVGDGHSIVVGATEASDVGESEDHVPNVRHDQKNGEGAMQNPFLR